MEQAAGAVAELIDRLKEYFVAGGLSLVLLNDDDVLRLMERKGYDPGTTIALGRRDNTKYTDLPPLWDAVSAVRGDPQFNLDYLGLLLTVIVSWVGDALAQHRYFDQTPELLFFRHLRNALSHGNKWHFLGAEPRQPAYFGSFVLSKSMHGDEGVLFGFMSTGDVLDLLDHTAAHLRSLRDSQR